MMLQVEQQEERIISRSAVVLEPLLLACRFACETKQPKVRDALSGLDVSTP
jgi:hypothetical protein